MSTAVLPDIDLEELIGHVISCKKCDNEAEWVLVKPCTCEEDHDLLCDPCLNKLYAMHHSLLGGGAFTGRWVCGKCHCTIGRSPDVRDLFRRLG